MKKIDILKSIVKMVRPLDAPVKNFEEGIRRGPFRILISVLLSSRTKDPVTLKASQRLFKMVDTPIKMSGMEEKEIAELIYPVGFYKQKAKHLKKIAKILTGFVDHAVPDNFDGLVALPGVGRKTANLVLALAFGIPAIAVDTHVFRISQRLGWASGEKPEEIEKQLKKAFPKNKWNSINQTLVGFGQTLCKPLSPHCDRCTITNYCSFYNSRYS